MLGGVSRRSRASRSVTLRHMNAEKKAEEFAPPPPGEDDKESLMKKLARREADKKIEELATNHDDDAHSYFAALRRINNEKYVLHFTPNTHKTTSKPTARNSNRP